MALSTFNWVPWYGPESKKTDDVGFEIPGLVTGHVYPLSNDEKGRTVIYLNCAPTREVIDFVYQGTTEDAKIWIEGWVSGYFRQSCLPPMNVVLGKA